MSHTETDTPYSEMVDTIEALGDEDLAKELSFAEGFGSSPDDERVNVWLEAVRHESRCRGIFVVGDSGYTSVEDWMYDSDYAIAPDVGWVQVDSGQGPYDPLETYAYAHQAMSWADALDTVLQA